MPATGAAAVVELLAEPLYILAAVQLRFGLRAAVDAAALLTKSAATLALLTTLRGMPSALVFSAAQLASALVALLGYGVWGALLLRRHQAGKQV